MAQRGRLQDKIRVAEVICNDDERSEETHANKELICLAVNSHADLLAACEALTAAQDAMQGPSDYLLWAAREAAKAAIAKAGGRA